MSTGKRLAKRSILGTRVAVQGADGRYLGGVIQAVKTTEGSTARYSVRLEEPRARVFEFNGTDLVGPGFRHVTDLERLPEGQRIYVTHRGREVAARVARHDADEGEVLVAVDRGDDEEVNVSKQINVPKLNDQ